MKQYNYNGSCDICGVETVESRLTHINHDGTGITAHPECLDHFVNDAAFRQNVLERLAKKRARALQFKNWWLMSNAEREKLLRGE